MAKPSDKLQQETQQRREKQATTVSRQVSKFAQQRLAAMKSPTGEVVDLTDGETRPFCEIVVEAMKLAESQEARAASPTRGRGAKKGAAHAMLASHQRVFQAALDLELQEEWMESDERLRTWSRARLETEGFAIFGMSCQPDSSLFRDTILRFYVPALPLPHNNFTQGDIVLVSSGVPTDDSFEGVVLDYSTRWIRVALPTSVAGAVQGGGWRLDLYANTIAYERCHRAVDQFCHPPSAASSSSSSDASDSADAVEAAEAGQRLLLRALSGTIPPGISLEAMASQAPSWTRGPAGAERVGAARRLLASLSDQLNPSQRAAVDATFTRTLTLWQGPPGTGKTRTLLRMLRAVLPAVPAGRAVLAAAASNVAVDNLVAGLLELGVRVVRIGQPVKVAPELRKVTMEALIADTPLGAEAVALRKRANSVGGSEGYMLVQEAMQLEERAAQQILNNAQVVACTCVGAGDARLEGRIFPLLVLDEATQATEPASLISIMSARVQSLVLVGDPQQLPPTVKSRQALDLGLNITLFERLQRMGLRPLLLDTQYRMHPSICEFPSRAFYKGRLRSAPTPQDRPAPPGFPWPNEKAPVCFLPVTWGQEQRTASNKSAAADADAAGGTGGTGGYSFYNVAEARAAVLAVRKLLAGGGLPGGAADVGVITPYNGQVREIQRQLAAASSSTRGPASSPRSSNSGGNGGAASMEGLEVKSVDGFQGREKEVILFSAVRSNASGSVGFLADYRRLNVALTRARRGLIVLGDPTTLQHDATWGAWLKWTRERGMWLDGWDRR